MTDALAPKVGVLTSWVSVGNNETTSLVVELVGVPNDLVHQTRETNRIFLRTRSSYDQVGECNVVFMIDIPYNPFRDDIPHPPTKRLAKADKSKPQSVVIGKEESCGYVPVAW